MQQAWVVEKKPDLYVMQAYHSVIPMTFGTIIIRAPLTPDFAGKPTWNKTEHCQYESALKQGDFLKIGKLWKII